MIWVAVEINDFFNKFACWRDPVMMAWREELKSVVQRMWRVIYDGGGFPSDCLSVEVSEWGLCGACYYVCVFDDSWQFGYVFNRKKGVSGWNVVSEDRFKQFLSLLTLKLLSFLSRKSHCCAFLCSAWTEKNNVLSTSMPRYPKASTCSTSCPLISSMCSSVWAASPNVTLLQRHNSLVLVMLSSKELSSIRVTSESTCWWYVARIWIMMNKSWRVNKFYWITSWNDYFISLTFAHSSAV